MPRPDLPGSHQRSNNRPKGRNKLLGGFLLGVVTTIIGIGLADNFGVPVCQTITTGDETARWQTKDAVTGNTPAP